eukprot:7832013-Pyramimonas_sp.AAC.1
MEVPSGRKPGDPADILDAQMTDVPLHLWKKAAARYNGGGLGRSGADTTDSSPAGVAAVASQLPGVQRAA